MRRFEDNRIFDANADEIGNREKSPVIDALVQVLPERQLVILFARAIVAAAQGCRDRLPCR